MIRAYIEGIDVNSVSVKAARLHVASTLGVSIDEKSERKRLKNILVSIVTGLAPPGSPQTPSASATTTKPPKFQEVQHTAGPAAPPVPPSSSAPGQPAGEAKLTEEEIMQIARKRRYHTLSPQLSRVCGGRTVASRGMVLRYLWDYIKANGLQDSQQKLMLNLDAPMRAVAPSDWPAQVSSRKLTGMFGGHLSDYSGPPPAEEVQAIRAKPPKPTGRKKQADDSSSVTGSVASSAARAQKRPRDDAVGLPEGVQLLKRPRANKYYSISPQLQALLPADKAGCTVASRQQVTKWIWDHIKAHGLQSTEHKTRVRLDAALRAVLGGGDEKGTLHMFHIAKHVGQHLTPYEGPIPAADQAEYERGMAAFEAQQAQLKAMGVDPAAVRKAARIADGGSSVAAAAAAPALYVLDDAATAMLGARVCSRKQLLTAISTYLQDHKLCSAEGSVSPDAPLARMLHTSASISLETLVDGLAPHVTVVPVGCKHSSAAGLQDGTGFTGTKHRAKVAAALRASLRVSGAAGPAASAGPGHAQPAAGVFDAFSDEETGQTNGSDQDSDASGD